MNLWVNSSKSLDVGKRLKIWWDEKNMSMQSNFCLEPWKGWLMRLKQGHWKEGRKE